MDCFTASCVNGSCGCPSAMGHCQGCSSPRATCIRIEQMHSHQPMKLCQMLAYERSNPNKRCKMFSAGGAHSHNYDNLLMLSKGKLDVRFIVFLCTEFISTHPVLLTSSNLLRAKLLPCKRTARHSSATMVMNRRSFIWPSPSQVSPWMGITQMTLVRFPC